MKAARLAVLLCGVLMVIIPAGGALSADISSDEEGDRIFQVLDKNGDGRISREEWDAIDANKDGTIIPEELERFHFRASRPYRWVDTNRDGYMDREEFLNNFSK